LFWCSGCGRGRCNVIVVVWILGGASALSTVTLFGGGVVKVGSLVWLHQRSGEWGNGGRETHWGWGRME
jgi:hypothetical protein